MNRTAEAKPALPARWVSSQAAPWVPGGKGKSSKPLRFLAGDRGFVELLRLEPGAAMPWHRHSGEVHAFNLEGTRQLNTGELIGPGDYVYEPTGNTDWWKVVGDTPLVVMVVVMGHVEYLGPGKEVLSRVDAKTQREAYLQYCAQQHIEPLDLDE